MRLSKWSDFAQLSSTIRLSNNKEKDAIFREIFGKIGTENFSENSVRQNFRKTDFFSYSESGRNCMQNFHISSSNLD